MWRIGFSSEFKTPSFWLRLSGGAPERFIKSHFQPHIGKIVSRCGFVGKIRPKLTPVTLETTSPNALHLHDRIFFRVQNSLFPITFFWRNPPNVFLNRLFQPHLGKIVFRSGFVEKYGQKRIGKALPPITYWWRWSSNIDGSFSDAVCYDFSITKARGTMDTDFALKTVS